MKHTVTEHKLPSGAAGLVIDVPGSGVVSLHARFNSGYQFAPEDKYEVPHVMEHLLATVTKMHPGPNEFNIEVQKNGAYLNANTSVDGNGYVYECADFELDRILDLLQEQLVQPLFAEAPFRAEVGNVREELTRNTTQFGAMCSLQLAAAAYPKLWLGYEERIAQLPGLAVGDLESHYRHTHTAANARFFVAGHFPDGGARLAARLERLYHQLPRGKRLPVRSDMGRGLKRAVVRTHDIAQLYYRLGLYFGELLPTERRALTLLRMVLVGGMGSRIYGEARRRGLAYGVSGMGHAEPGNSSFGLAGYVTVANAPDLFALMVRELQAVRRGALTKAELQAAQNLLVGSVKRSVQTPGDLLGWYLDPYDETGEVRDLDRELELLREITPEQVTAVADKALAAGRRGLSLVGPVNEAQAAPFEQIFAQLS